MTAAIFGLIGVVFGAVVASSAQYFFDRRNGWNEARGAGLILYAIVARAEMLLEANPAQTPTMAELGLDAWASNRQALLFRKGNFPSGLSVRQWLGLGAQFTELERLAQSARPAAELLVLVRAAKAELADFTYDDFTLPRLIANGAKNIWLFSTRWR